MWCLKFVLDTTKLFSIQNYWSSSLSFISPMPWFPIIYLRFLCPLVFPIFAFLSHPLLLVIVYSEPFLLVRLVIRKNVNFVFWCYRYTCKIFKFAEFAFIIILTSMILSFSVLYPSTAPFNFLLTINVTPFLGLLSDLIISVYYLLFWCVLLFSDVF